MVHHYQPPRYERNIPGPVPIGGSSDSWVQAVKPFVDPLTTSSGFAAEKGPFNASFTRSLGENGQFIPPVHVAQRGEPPRKRINRGASPADPIDLFSVPDSPEVQRIGQRKRPIISRIVSSASEDDSLAESVHSVAGPSRARIVKGHHSHSPHPDPPATDSTQLDAERFTKFKITQPMHSADTARAAWQQAGGDVSKAEALLNSNSWRPPSAVSSPDKTSQSSQFFANETGRVKELDDANKAERARVRAMGKKSLIYQNRVALNDKPLSQDSTPSTPKITIDLTKSSPATPPSPDVLQRPAKRLKRKVVQSDSEPESIESDDDDLDTSSMLRFGNNGGTQKQTLTYFNSVAAEALQELSGKEHSVLGYTFAHSNGCFRMHHSASQHNHWAPTILFG